MPRLDEWYQYITPDGITYDLSGKTDRAVYNINGLGLPRRRDTTDQGPFQDGDTLLDTTIPARLIQMIHRRFGDSREGYWQTKREVENIMRHNRVGLSAGTLRFILPIGETYTINAQITDALDQTVLDNSAWDEWNNSFALRFIARSPFFVNEVVNTINLTAGAGDELQFPATFPIQFDSGLINVTVPATSGGTAKVYPIFTIQGPLNNPILSNLTTGEIIEIEYSVSQGETVTVLLTDDTKSITSDVVGRLSATPQSNLGTWHLAPGETAPSGINTLNIRGAGADPNFTSVMMTWQDRRLSL